MTLADAVAELRIDLEEAGNAGMWLVSTATLRRVLDLIEEDAASSLSREELL